MALVKTFLSGKYVNEGAHTFDDAQPSPRYVLVIAIGKVPTNKDFTKTRALLNLFRNVMNYSN